MKHVNPDREVHERKGETAVKSILDSSFRYTKSVDTDIRKTFARVRKQQGAAAAAQAAKVAPIRKVGAAGSKS